MLSDLAARAHSSIPVIYGLTATLSFAYFCALLWSATIAERAATGLGAAIQAFAEHDATNTLLWSLTVTVLFFLLFRVFNHPLLVMLGLALWIV